MKRSMKISLKIWLRVVAVLVGLLAVASSFVVWVLKSDWLREQVRAAIVKEAEKATGGKVELGSFRFDWQTLTAEVGPFTIHGTEPAGSMPLLTAAKVRVGLQVISFFAKDIRIASMEGTAPQAHLIVTADGHTNIPEPKLKKKGKGAAETILDLKIGKFALTQGSLLLELPGSAPQVKPWEARGEGLAAAVAYEAAGTRYSGDVGVRKMRITGLTGSPLDVEVKARAAMEADRLLITEALLKSARSEVQLKNTMLQHFAAPVWTGQYRAKAELSEFTKLVKGVVSAAGSARFVSTTEYQVSGQMTGTGVEFERFRNARVTGDFELNPEHLLVKRADVRVLGGAITGAAELVKFEQFKAAGQVEGFQLADVAALRTTQRLPYNALISGPFEIHGNWKRQVGSADLRIAPSKTGPAARGLVPVKFDTGSQRLELGHAVVDLPHSHVEATGTLGAASLGAASLGAVLEVTLESHDATDLLPWLLDFPKPDLAYGGLIFNGTLNGPLLHPAIAGTLAAQAVKFQQQLFDSVAGDMTLTENLLTVAKGTVVYAGIRGTGSGTLRLANWLISEASAVTGAGAVSGAEIPKLLGLAGRKDVDITGTMSANAQVSGTLGDPRANGDVSLNNGAIYGQPYDSISGKVQFLSKTAQTMNGTFVSGPKRVNIVARFDRSGAAFPAGKMEFNLTSNTMPLNEIHLVRERQPDIHGFGKFHADGVLRISHDPKNELQFDLAALNADASANGLELTGRNLGDAHFTAQTKGEVLEARFDSNAARASIHGESTVRLGGDYPVDARVKFTNAGLNAMAMLALKASDSSSFDFDGTAEGEVVVRGPARRPEEMTAAIDIPKIEMRALAGSDLSHSLPNFVISNNGPIRISVNHSQVRVESARLKAPETDVTLTGTMALTEPQTLNLKILGNVNLALAKTFTPDITATGLLTLDGTIRGNPASPEVNGVAQLRNGEIHYADFSNGLSNATGEIAFSGTRATIQSLKADSGGGKVEASGFAAFTAGQLSFRVQAKARAVRVRYPEGVSSISDADVTLAGSSKRSDVSGSVTIHRVAINPKSDAATILAASAQPLKTASAQNSIASNMNLDVQISTAPDVALQTSVTQSIQADANLRLRGTVTNPAVLGRINVTQGELVFLSNKYSINQGTISFFNSAKIEPVLNIDLETKARGVEVILTVSGPVNKLNLTYRSDPPLQFSDIVALLAAGRTPTDPTLAVRDTGQTQSFQQLGADTLIGQAIANPVAGRLQRFFGVSRIKIDPQLTGITGSPQARLTIEQQVTPEILFTYITDVSSTSTQLIRVEWAFNPAWSAILLREENGYVGLDFAYKKRFK